MEFSIQPLLENEQAALLPLEEEDFDSLYAVASEPAIWEQHPNKDRWKKDVFSTFFDGAIQSKGAFKILDKSTGKVIGSTRFYQYDAESNSVKIGYTFYATAYWGTGINPGVKTLMLDYIFQYVNRVYFEVGPYNTRSQIAVSRLGAKKLEEQEANRLKDKPKDHIVYYMDKR